MGISAQLTCFFSRILIHWVRKVGQVGWSGEFGLGGSKSIKVTRKSQAGKVGMELLVQVQS